MITLIALNLVTGFRLAWTCPPCRWMAGFDSTDFSWPEVAEAVSPVIPFFSKLKDSYGGFTVREGSA
jgi:hypothetical protein